MNGRRRAQDRPITAGFASWHVLVSLALLAAVLLIFQRFAARSEVQLALGRPTSAQADFFEQASKRPDLELFFKGLLPEQRIRLARNLGEQETPGSVAAAVRLLATFDDQAREELSVALERIATKEPKLVAAELGRTSGFEQRGVFRALRFAGEPGIAAAADALADPAKRAEAIRFLAEGALIRTSRDQPSSEASGPEAGQPATPGDRERRLQEWSAQVARAVLPYLRHEDADVRSAAAETLGKVRSREAVVPLLDQLKSAEEPERTTIVAALADIGDEAAEGALLAEIAQSPTVSPRLMSGLGRIGTPRALAALAALHGTGSADQKEAAIDSLALAEDRALRVDLVPEVRIRVAGLVRSAEADRLLRAALKTEAWSELALTASRGRESLADVIWPAGASFPIPAAIDRIEVLGTTRAGRVILRRLESDPDVGGFARRARVLAEGVR